MSAVLMNAPMAHRKPLPGHAMPGQALPQQHLGSSFTDHQDHAYVRPRASASNMTTNNNPSHAPSDRSFSMPRPPQHYPPQQQAPHNYNPAQPTYQTPQYQPYQQPSYDPNTRRTLSSATSSTSSNGTNNGMQRMSTASSTFAPSNVPRRSTSSRSNGSASPTSYVALMRKQKATVWCDRAQHEDPRILAAQRAAKMRAVMEVAGRHNARQSTSSTSMVGGVRSKIRHHGAPKASTYNGSYVSAAGVPMRLSATEVDEEESDEEGSRLNSIAAASSTGNSKLVSRNGSGRSSLASAYRNIGPGHYGPAYHTGQTPLDQSPVDSVGGMPGDETPMPHQFEHADDYFGQSGGQGGSGGSGNSSTKEKGFGSVGGLPHMTKAEVDRKAEEDLKRRGSVDDRTMTMGGGRLFVANPDLSD